MPSSRSAKDFFRPLAVGAPEPLREIPARPSRAIHFFDPSNPKMAAKVADGIDQTSPGDYTADLGDEDVEVEIDPHRPAHA